MATDEHLREQRLRKQAELQSLYLNLANLRKQEATYIETSAGLPDLLVHQINEVRQEIRQVEDELLGLHDQAIQTSARQFYREAFEAERAGDSDKAIKLYRNASHYNHPDAGAAIRSVRYARKIAKSKAAGAGKSWVSPSSARQSRNRFLVGLAALLILILIVIFVLNNFFFSSPPEVASAEPTATPTSPAVILIVPDTATPVPTNTPLPSATPIPTNTPSPTLASVLPTTSPTPTPIPTLRSAPIIIGPQNNLVWQDGAIVFEFREVALADDELYCLNTLRGFDQTNTENWSFPATGNKKPAIPIEANVIRVAKDSRMRCIVWSASIGKGSCENIISKSTEERIIGLPQPCDFE